MYTTAFITQIIDTPFPELVKLFGLDNAKLVWESGREAINLIEDIIKKEEIDCEFKFVPAYTYAQDEKQLKELENAYKMIKRSGFDVQFYPDANKLNFTNAGYLEVPKQALFHPIKFAQKLAHLAEAAGAKIYTNSEVLNTDNLKVTTKTASVRAQDVVIATYYPLTQESTHFKKAMYVSYVYELEIPSGQIAEGMYLDMNNPYHYFRIDKFGSFDRMIVGGEDHRKDVKINPDKNFAALEKYIKNILGNSSYKITRKWSGNILEPADGLALIGKIKPHTYVTTAFSGNGMTYSAISALIIRDLIHHTKNPYSHLYNPKRSPTLGQLFRKGSDYAQEFVGGALKNFFSH